MKTAPAGQDYIDYWHRKNDTWSGVRVWSGHCQIIKSNTGPEAFAVSGDVLKLPLRHQMLDSISPAGWTYLDSKPQITHEVLVHVKSNPDSDLVKVLTQEKTFEEARQSASESYVE
jgi:hypothetical protein